MGWMSGFIDLKCDEQSLVYDINSRKCNFYRERNEKDSESFINIKNT
jgi:hypothetical protein